MHVWKVICVRSFTRLSVFRSLKGIDLSHCWLLTNSFASSPASKQPLTSVTIFTPFHAPLISNAFLTFHANSNDGQTNKQNATAVNMVWGSCGNYLSEPMIQTLAHILTQIALQLYERARTQNGASNNRAESMVACTCGWSVASALLWRGKEESESEQHNPRRDHILYVWWVPTQRRRRLRKLLLLHSWDLVS